MPRSVVPWLHLAKKASLSNLNLNLFYHFCTNLILEHLLLTYNWRRRKSIQRNPLPFQMLQRQQRPLLLLVFQQGPLQRRPSSEN